jgi:hypothetical protein
LSAGFWELTPELPASPASEHGGTSLRFESLEVLLSDGQELHCTIEAQRHPFALASVVGAVQQDGAPMHGVLVRLRPLEQPSHGQPRERRGPSGDHALRRRANVASELPQPERIWTHRCETVDGAFAFEDLAAGSDYELRFEVASGGRLQFLGRRTVRAGTPEHPARVELVMSTAAVRLTCVRANQPFANRMVRLRQVLPHGDEGARFDLLLDDAGELFIEALPAGTWTVEPTHGGSCRPADFEVVPGRPLAVMIQIGGAR